MILNKIEDPRDNLEKARRQELVRFAHACGLSNITDQVPAILIRAELRAKGLTNINIPRRVLGAQNQNGAPTLPPGAQEKVVQVSAADDLARQFRQQPPPPPAPPAAKPERPAKFKRLVERPKQEINLLRDECKRLGIKMDRRDNKQALKDKIAAHGKDTLELRQ